VLDATHVTGAPCYTRTHKRFVYMHTQQTLNEAVAQAQAWPAHDQYLLQQQQGLTASVDVLTHQTDVLQQAALPSEARRRQLLGLLHRIAPEAWAKVPRCQGKSVPLQNVGPLQPLTQKLPEAFLDERDHTRSK